MSKLLIAKCREANMLPNDLIALYCVVFNINYDFLQDNQSTDFLYEENYIDSDNHPTDKGKRFIADYASAQSILEGKGKTTSKQVDKSILEAEISNYIEDFRNLFRGLKIGVMGDKKACLSKMIDFYQEYPQFANQELIFKATRMYINATNDHRYLMKADYFIYKTDQNKNRISNLAVYAEEVDMEKTEYKQHTQMI